MLRELSNRILIEREKNKLSNIQKNCNTIKVHTTSIGLLVSGIVGKFFQSYKGEVFVSIYASRIVLPFPVPDGTDVKTSINLNRVNRFLEIFYIFIVKYCVVGIQQLQN